MWCMHLLVDAAAEYARSNQFRPFAATTLESGCTRTGTSGSRSARRDRPKGGHGRTLHCRRFRYRTGKGSTASPTDSRQERKHAAGWGVDVSLLIPGTGPSSVQACKRISYSERRCKVRRRAGAQRCGHGTNSRRGPRRSWRRAQVLQGIPGHEGWKATEVPVGGPDLRDAVREAQCRDSCVMHQRAFHPAASKQTLQHFPM